MPEPKQTLKQLLNHQVTNADAVYFSNHLSHLVEHFGRVGDTNTFANFYCPTRVKEDLTLRIQDVSDAHSRAHGGFIKTNLERRKSRMENLLRRLDDIIPDSH
jgi:hypothetical protein